MPFETLRKMRAWGAPPRTVGLPDDVIGRFTATHPSLVRAIGEADVQHRRIRQEFPEILALDEPAQVHAVQSSFVNFYADSTVNPYVALAARGPWVVTCKGAVLHDSGGYGMLGLGHAPDGVLDVLRRPHVMANIMTPSFGQLHLVQALNREIGRQRSQGCPFTKFLCVNSGSEAVTLAARLSDVNAKLQTDPGGKYAGRKIKVVALKGGFHGRTDRPAQFSDSTREAYESHLASFRNHDNLLTVEPNDCAGLREQFDRALREHCFVEALFLEPVMGEGNPGMAITREFYDTARELASRHDALMIVDSIQAGLRAAGCLSIVDYPGFEDAQAPDIESYSKALNAGQYPLSVLAMTDRAAELYRSGVYGNTMTTNPKAMDVACVVLDAITPELRNNIRERGVEFVQKLQALADELDGPIVRVQGTGLLCSAEVEPRFRAYGYGSLEEHLRLNGIGVIHGGENSLRYTPHFAVTSEEIDLIVQATGDAIRHASETTPA